MRELEIQKVYTTQEVLETQLQTTQHTDKNHKKIWRKIRDFFHIVIN